MAQFRSEDILVGLIAFAAVPWIIGLLVRGRRDRRLPIGRGYVLQDERPGAYRALLMVYIAAAALMLFIALDLMLGSGSN